MLLSLLQPRESISLGQRDTINTTKHWELEKRILCERNRENKRRDVETNKERKHASDETSKEYTY